MSIFRLSLANRKGEMGRVNFALGEFLEEEGVPPKRAHRVRLVVEELLVNVIQHAYDDDGKHTILLDVRTEPNGVAVVVEDDGKPYDPRRTSSPTPKELLEAGKSHGLGVVIVKKVARDFGYERVAGRNRVRVFV
jgi:anti-sigma regulatory factor (Ser/Thr protein kinase)